MPHINDLVQSRYLSKSDCAKPILVTIGGYAQVNVALENDPEKLRWVLNFHEIDKPFVLNTTNGQLIAQATGSEDFDGWIGKQIVIFNDPAIMFGGKMIGGLRVRAPKRPAGAPIAAQPAKPVPAAAPPEDDGSDVPF